MLRFTPKLARPLVKIACRQTARTLVTGSSPGMVIVASGPDRVGLIANVTKRILEAGGNISDSKSIKLRGTFTMSLLVCNVAETTTSFQSLIQETLPDFSVSVTEANAAADDIKPNAFTARFSISTADNVGLINKITNFLVKRNMNISVLESSQEIAPHGGTTLFSMEGIMSSKDPVDVNQLDDDLTALESEMGVDVEFEQAFEGDEVTK